MIPEGEEASERWLDNMLKWMLKKEDVEEETKDLARKMLEVSPVKESKKAVKDSG